MASPTSMNLMKKAATAGSGLNNPVKSNDALLLEIAAVEADLTKLRIRFEQHFIGIERKSPVADLEALGRRVKMLKGAFFNNTALKFRVETISHKFSTYEQLWLKTLKEIEEGTYRKDLMRARMNNLRKGTAGTPPKPGIPKPEDTTTPATSAPSGPMSGLSNDQVDRIYEAYILARRRCNESTVGITREALAKNIAARAATHDVKVVIKDGKAMLKLVNKAGT